MGYLSALKVTNVPITIAHIGIAIEEVDLCSRAIPTYLRADVESSRIRSFQESVLVQTVPRLGPDK